MHYEALQSVSFLKNLSTDELGAFASLAVPRTVKRGDKIIVEGEPVTALFIVAKGTVHVRRQAMKREVLLGRIGPGGFFGEINLFDPGTATATVQAMGDVELAAIGHETLRNFMSENPATGYKITAALLGEVSRRLRLTNQRLVNAVYWASADKGQVPTQEP